MMHSSKKKGSVRPPWDFRRNLKGVKGVLAQHAK